MLPSNAKSHPHPHPPIYSDKPPSTYHARTTSIKSASTRLRKLPVPSLIALFLFLIYLNSVFRSRPQVIFDPSTPHSRNIPDPSASPSNTLDTTPPSLNSHAFWASWSFPTSFWLKSTADSSKTVKELTASLPGSNPHDWPSPTPPLLDPNVTLQERLQTWRMAPLPEPALWVQFNLQTCSDDRIGKNANYDLLKRAHLMWATMNSTHIRQKREELITFLEKADRNGLLSPAHWGRGRGIVFTAGNVDTFSRVLLTVRMLREHLKSELPVEIFSFPGETPSPDVRQALESLDVKLGVVGWAKKDSHRSKNFHIKASALLACSFQEPLYLDSDNLPAVLEPGVLESLWESKGYKKLGALFWPDFWKTHADVPIWLLIGTQCRDEWEQEAGQILIDKSKHLDMLLLSEFMLKDWRYWFQISDGDKDVFRYAMLALRKRWALPGRFLGSAGLSWDTLSGYCGHTMLQHDPSGRPLFVHMNLLKQIPSGLSRGTTFKRTRTVEVELLPEEVPADFGVEADMLANADETGKAIIDAPAPVRRRAALERGLKPFMHGGSVSAICTDIKWEDPGLKPIEKQVEKWENPTRLVMWNDDPRLKSFEDRFYDMGGVTNAVGF